jgi:hypothetical protein
MQLNGQVSNFKQRAESAKDFWVGITPLSNCPDSVRAIIVDDKICNVPDQENIMTDPDVSIETLDKITKCAKSWGYDGQYTRIVGILSSQYVVAMSGGAIMGYTLGYGYPVVSGSADIEGTTGHETGHTFGLCDEGYGGGYCSNSGCASGYCMSSSGGTGCDAGSECCPNKPESNSIMCSSDMCNSGCTGGNQFASSSYAHLEKELNRYCRE